MKNAVFAFLTFIGLTVSVLADTEANLAAKAIPTEAKCYFDAVAQKDVQVLGNCFLADAVIIDVNREISGIDAIRSWAEAEVFGGRYEILEIVTQKPDHVKLLIRFVPPGWGGSSSQGFRAHYTFEFSRGKITRMDLQYA